MGQEKSTKFPFINLRHVLIGTILEKCLEQQAFHFLCRAAYVVPDNLKIFFSSQVLKNKKKSVNKKMRHVEHIVVEHVLLVFRTIFRMEKEEGVKNFFVNSFYSVLLQEKDKIYHEISCSKKSRELLCNKVILWRNKHPPCKGCNK